MSVTVHKLVTVAILIIGCSLHDAAPAADKTFAYTSQSLKKDLDKFVAAKLKAACIPGYSLLVAKDGEVLFDHAYGFEDLKTKKPTLPHIVPEEKIGCGWLEQSPL